jgi:DNA polymerase elongation subunit (family B)
VRVLLLDIETAPNIGQVWDIWNQNIGINQLQASGYVQCWAAKWIGKKEVFFESNWRQSHSKMLRPIHRLLSDADAVVSWNGARFDTPTLNKEFLLNGILPPAPYKEIDLFVVAKSRFKFVSNKLEYVADALGCGKKDLHPEFPGHELWAECLKGNPKAWKVMERYNKNDTVIMEAMYEKFLPWINDHPHSGLYSGAPTVCPNCSASSLQSRGFAYTKLSQYRRFVCTACGTWVRGKKRTMGAETRGVV